MTEQVKPTDDAIVIAALSFSAKWARANEIRGRLKRFGFDPSTQQVAAWLNRLVREDCPMFERKKPWEMEYEYRVTNFGRNQISNRFPGLKTWNDYPGGEQ